MIQKINEQDIPKVLSWASDAQSPGYFWPEEILKSELLFQETYVWYLNSQTGPVAVVCLRVGLDAYEISVLATHPDHRKKGYMSSLIQNLTTTLHPKKPLWLEVHESNLGARNLYQKLGFKEVGRRPNYYRDGGSALLLSLP